MCPFLKKHFDMGLWHPTDEASLDALMNAEIELYALSFCIVHCGARLIVI